MDAKLRLDAIGRTLVLALQENARASYAELGRLVGLSPPAVAERVKRLEDQGVIKGFRAEVDRGRLGYGMSAFVRLRCRAETFPAVEAFARTVPEVVECHEVAGEDAYVFKVVARSIQHLDEILLRLAAFGATTSSLILSSPVAGRVLPPAGE